MVALGRASGVKTKPNQNDKLQKKISYWIDQITTSAVEKQGTGRNCATVSRKPRGEKRVRRQKRDEESHECRIERMSSNMIGKGRELAYMMQRRKVDVQETRGKGSEATNIGAGVQNGLSWCGKEEKWILE